MKLSQYRINVINITTQPHSPENYIQLFKKAFAQSPVKTKYFGTDNISLRDIRIQEDADYSIVTGNIYKFTQISDNDWYDAIKGCPLSDDNKPQFDTSRLFPNLTTYPFCFIANGHRFFFVSKFKQDSLSVKFLTHSLYNLLNTPELIEEFGKVTVFVETDIQTLDEINAIDILQTLQIKLYLPNDDDISNEKERFVKRMKNQNSRGISETLIAEKGQTIIPDEETKAHMELALSNGIIIAKGIENEKKVVKRSIDSPQEFNEDYIERNGSLSQHIIDFAKKKINFFIKRQL